MYDERAKIPATVPYTLTPEHTNGCVSRSNAFAVDSSNPRSSSPSDYSGSAYDKGHLSPDGDQNWSELTELESFHMTNMAPQAPSLNRGIWKLLETSVRGWVNQRQHAYTIYPGSIYSYSDPTINGVVVPHAFYKVVIDDVTGEVAGWEFPHVQPYPNLGNDLTKFRKPVAAIMADAGVHFKFPSNARELSVGSEWSVDFRALTASKRAKCGKNANRSEQD